MLQLTYGQRHDTRSGPARDDLSHRSPRRVQDLQGIGLSRRTGPVVGGQPGLVVAVSPFQASLEILRAPRNTHLRTEEGLGLVIKAEFQGRFEENLEQAEGTGREGAVGEALGVRIRFDVVEIELVLVAEGEGIARGFDLNLGGEEPGIQPIRGGRAVDQTTKVRAEGHQTAISWTCWRCWRSCVPMYSV